MCVLVQIVVSGGSSAIIAIVNQTTAACTASVTGLSSTSVSAQDCLALVVLGGRNCSFCWVALWSVATWQHQHVGLVGVCGSYELTG